MSDEKPPLSDAQIATSFRALADEYAGQRVASDRRRAELRMQIGQPLVHASREPSRTYRLLVRRALPAVAAALFTWGAVVWLSPDPLLEYTLSGAVERDGVIRTSEQPGTVNFSDASAIEAAPRTTLDLDVVGERAALARLQKGELRVAIRHEEDTDWRFLAGPYEVRVIGTRFELGWDPEQSALSLVMREGKVRVVGPELDRVLVAGEALRVSRPTPEPTPASASSEPARSSSPAAPLSAKPLALPAPVPNTAARQAWDTPANIPTVQKDWSTLVAAGRFDEVVREAQTQGIARVHEESKAADLRALAQAAAYTGRAELAVKSWSVVRRRFQGRDAQHAAFFLGRIYDQQGRTAEALSWLRTYLKEAPQGVYAAEALGGVLTLVRRRDGNAAAQPLARSYLERFPKGSYAAAARAVLDGQ